MSSFINFNFWIYRGIDKSVDNVDKQEAILMVIEMVKSIEM